MSIERRVQLIENLFHQLEQETAQFEKASGIGCPTNCGQCCTNPTIEASPLEFLPWAFHLFVNGEAENFLVQLKENKTSTCWLYQPLSVLGQGRCSDYKYRGLICRLFGYAANKDKYGELRMATCKIIKENQSEAYQTTSKAINEGMQIPILTDYYMQLNQIDFHLGNRVVPINQALKMALEEVMQYYAYRPFPDVGEKLL